jgi:glycosyltransferase involved in cell wall biosynthesis
MRIAYVAPYQGPTVVACRPIIRNNSLAAKVKIELVAELLKKSGHDVEVISQGEVTENSLKFYQGFREPAPFDPDIPVEYSSTLTARFINIVWSSIATLQRLRSRHRVRPFDAMLFYNFKLPQVVCANYAFRLLGIPVILEYEDDAFVDVNGKSERGFRSRCQLYAARKTLQVTSGCIGVSPHLLAQAPSSIPKLLLPGMVSSEILEIIKAGELPRKNRIVFSGTFYKTKGLEQLIEAWNSSSIQDWELHIAGDGETNEMLREMAHGNSSIVFHGLLDRKENARLLCSARIGVNPHDVSATLGNVFAFKIIEYLAAGLHVISTPMGPLAPQLEAGITYMPDNKPQTVAATLKHVIESRSYGRTAAQAALQTYGPEAISKSLNMLVKQVLTRSAKTST